MMRSILLGSLLAGAASFGLAGCVTRVREPESERDVRPPKAGAAPSTAAPKGVATGMPAGAMVLSGPVAAATPVKTDENTAKEKALKRANLERQLVLERHKIEKAKIELANQEVANQGSLAKVEAELALAGRRLRHLEETEAPNRLAKARLDLAQAKDSLEEAKEELAQLEMMYKEQDLADKTREIVLNRGKRRVERATERLALQGKEIAALEGHVIPQDRAKAALEVEEKQRELDRARRGAETSMIEKRIALMGVESEIARLEAEIAAAAEPAPR